MRQLLSRTAAALALAALLAACTQKNTVDKQAQQDAAIPPVALGVDRFLLFPNPIGQDPFAQDGGTFETNTTEYATAYYAAIDGTNAKDTIDKWRAVNGFAGYATPARPGTEHLAVFRDVKDLGYGRRMTARRNSDDGSVVFYVDNYNVKPNGSTAYSSEFNVDAAIRRDTQWHVGTNAIEWSATPCLNIANGYPYNYDPPDCNGTAKFAKYYNFSSADGTRQLAVDLDGRGLKAMPGPCITCHGGRGDPLTPPDSSGKPRFPLVENLPSRKRGDVGARLHGQNVDSFTYSVTQPGFAKTDMQPFLKDFNQWILCTYPRDPLSDPALLPPTVNGGSWGSCTRPTAGANEWQGTAAQMIQEWYGGPGMPQGTFQDTYVPSGWSGNASLYSNVVAPYCRTCHILRGTKNQDDLDFMALAKFQGYADRIKVHVFDRGNMPLSLIPHSDFWNSSAPQMLASFVDSQLGPGSATSGGAPLMPGRSIADPGPNRMVRTGANAVLTGENSLFASSYEWSEPMPSGNVTISNPNNMVAIFNASVAGTYVVRLTVNGGAFKDVTITAVDDFPDTLNIRFAHVKNVMQNVLHNGTTTCRSCHFNTAVVPPIPPVFYNNFDRDGSGGAADATDEAWFLKAIGGRVNLTEISASPLLRKPSGNHHNGGQLFNLATTAGLRNYSLIYNWVLAGMQPGGVAASAVVNGGNLGSPTPVPLTFSGAPPYAAGIALDAGASIGATNFLWSVTGPSGPTGAVPFVLNPTSASATASPGFPPTLSLPNVGSYVVQLQVDDGISTDTTQQAITVSETPVVADFTPGSVGPPVNQSVTFSGTPLRGNITLTSSSSGSPVACQWQVTGPAGGTLDGVNTPATLTKSCGSPAILNVPLSSVGGTYVVTLTAISSLGVASAAVAHSLTVTSAGSGVVANAGGNSTLALTFTNPSTFVPFVGAQVAPSPTGIPVAPDISLNGTASTGPGTLTYSWSVIIAPGDATGSYAPSIASPSSVSTTLTVHRAGFYRVQLFVSNGLPAGPSNTATRDIQVNVPATSTIASMATTFANRGCTIGGCHASGSVNPPSWVNETVNGLTLRDRVFLRVGSAGLADPTSSQLLRCPAEGCAMAQQPGFNDGDTSSYTQFLNWIIGGAP